VPDEIREIANFVIKIVEIPRNNTHRGGIITPRKKCEINKFNLDEYFENERLIIIAVDI